MPGEDEMVGHLGDVETVLGPHLLHSEHVRKRTNLMLHGVQADLGIQVAKDVRYGATSGEL